MTGSLPGRIFISYRRQETAWPARQLYDLMVERFGADQVFKDVDNIKPGANFVDEITKAVGSCDVLLALIGTQWVTAIDEHGQRRLDDPGDFVRLEIKTALDRGVRVIPILIDEARMPQRNDLPPVLEDLAIRQAVEISPVTFDTKRLLQTVHDELTERHAPPPADLSPPPVATPKPKPEPRFSGRGRAIAGAAAGAVLVPVLVFAVSTWRPWDNGTAGGADTSASSTTPPSASPSTTPSPSPPTSVDGPAVLAHKGGYEEYTSETLRAFTSAALARYAVETDVRWTSDNRAVLVHDEAATKGLECNGEYKVPETTWRELDKNCRSRPDKDGKQYRIPTYAAAMDELANISGTWVYAEVKTDQTADQNREFVNVIENQGMSEQTVVTSFRRDRLGEIRAIDPDLRRMLFIQNERIPAAELSQDDLWGVAVHKDIVTKRYVRQLQAAGLKVIVWIVNDPADWAEARSAGADKVLTDYPKKYSTWVAGQSSA